MNSLAMIILGIVFVLGIGGFSILSFALLFFDDKLNKDKKTNAEIKIFPKNDDFSDKDSDLSDHSKVA